MKMQPTQLSKKFIATIKNQESLLDIYVLLMAIYGEYKSGILPIKSEINLEIYAFNDLYCELEKLNHYLSEPARELSLADFHKFMVFVSEYKNSSGQNLFNCEALVSAIYSLYSWKDRQNLDCSIETRRPVFSDHKAKYGYDEEFINFWISKRSFADLTDHHDNEDLLLLAGTRSPNAFRFMPKRLKKDKAFISKACEVSPISLFEASISLRSDEGYLFELAKENIEILRFAAPKIFKRAGVKHRYDSDIGPIWQYLKAKESKASIGDVIEPRIETEQEAKARRKLQTGM